MKNKKSFCKNVGQSPLVSSMYIYMKPELYTWTYILNFILKFVGDAILVIRNEVFIALPPIDANKSNLVTVGVYFFF